MLKHDAPKATPSNTFRGTIMTSKSASQEVDEYLERHGLVPLFEAMTAALLLHKPDEPCKFLADYLTGLQSQGAQSALTREDLRTMFNIFDVTGKGVVSIAQAEQALKTIAGPNASLQQKDAQPDKSIGCEVFVTNMHGALRAAAPAVAETAQ